MTGSTQGIGRAIAGALVAEGARVIINGRRDAAVRETVAALAKSGEAHGIAADMATAAGAQTRPRRARRGSAPVDILVNNVGFFEVRKFAEIPDREWTDMFELNVMSGVRLSRALLPGMLERDWGRIVFIASEQSVKPNPDMAHYAMSKTAPGLRSREASPISTKGTRVTVNSVLVAPTVVGGRRKSFLAKDRTGRRARRWTRCAPPTSDDRPFIAAAALGDAGGNRARRVVVPLL